jgi:hypothetical protein
MTKESQALNRSKAASWFTISSQFTHSDPTPPPSDAKELHKTRETAGYIVGDLPIQQIFLPLTTAQKEISFSNWWEMFQNKIPAT